MRGDIVKYHTVTQVHVKTTNVIRLKVVEGFTGDMIRPASQKMLPEVGGQELRAKGEGGGAKATKNLVSLQGEGNWDSCRVHWEKEQGEMNKDPCGCKQGGGRWVPPWPRGL